MTPYRVVVCEDDAQLGEDLARRCREIFAGWSVEAEVQLYASADALLPLYETGAVEEAKVIKDVARYAIFTSPSSHTTSKPRASQRARTGA